MFNKLGFIILIVFLSKNCARTEDTVCELKFELQNEIDSNSFDIISNSLYKLMYSSQSCSTMLFNSGSLAVTSTVPMSSVELISLGESSLVTTLQNIELNEFPPIAGTLNISDKDYLLLDNFYLSEPSQVPEIHINIINTRYSK